MPTGAGVDADEMKSECKDYGKHSTSNKLTGAKIAYLHIYMLTYVFICTYASALRFIITFYSTPNSDLSLPHFRSQQTTQYCKYYTVSYPFYVYAVAGRTTRRASTVASSVDEARGNISCVHTLTVCLRLFLTYVGVDVVLSKSEGIAS